MLRINDFAKEMQRLKETDKTLWQKLKEVIHNMLETLKSVIKVYSEYGPTSKEAQYVLEFSTEAQETLAKLYAEAFVDASQNYQQTQKNTTTDDCGVKIMLRGFTKDGRRIYETNFANNVSIDERIKEFKYKIATVFNLGAVELKTNVKKLKLKEINLLHKRICLEINMPNLLSMRQNKRLV